VKRGAYAAKRAWPIFSLLAAIVALSAFALVVTSRLSGSTARTQAISGSVEAFTAASPPCSKDWRNARSPTFVCERGRSDPRRGPPAQTLTCRNGSLAGSSACAAPKLRRDRAPLVRGVYGDWLRQLCPNAVEAGAAVLRKNALNPASRSPLQRGPTLRLTGAASILRQSPCSEAAD